MGCWIAIKDLNELKIEAFTKDANNLGCTSSIIRNRKNMSDTSSEILQFLNYAIEGSPTCNQIKK